MRITTKTHYATIGLIDLALNEREGPVALPDIAARQEISLLYLEQLFARLKHKGLVSSVRGRGGGYQLARAPGSISVAGITEAIDESIDTTRCGGQNNCQRGETCLSHHLWMDLSEHIHDFLDGITLADLIERNNIGAANPNVNSPSKISAGDALPRQQRLNQ